MLAARFEDLLVRDEPLLTHNNVVVECGVTDPAPARLSRRWRCCATPFLAVVRHLWIDQNLHDQALSATLAGGRRDISFIDRVSFELMRRRGLRRAFAFDRHFLDQGFELVGGR